MIKSAVNLQAFEQIKELKKIIKALKNDPVGVSQLELDLMKEKIRAIYEILSDVKNNKDTDQPIDKETSSQPEAESLSAIEKEPEPEAISELVMEFENDIETGTESISETDKKNHLQAQTPEPSLNLFEDPILTLDDQGEKPIGEKNAIENPVESIGDVIQSKKIVNLKLAIGINEKFFFLNELFEGKMNEYTDAIEKLDQEESLKGAMEYMLLLKEEKNWDEASEAYGQLKSFLERKFN